MMLLHIFVKSFPTGSSPGELSVPVLWIILCLWCCKLSTRVRCYQKMCSFHKLQPELMEVGYDLYHPCSFEVLGHKNLQVHFARRPSLWHHSEDTQWQQLCPSSEPFAQYCIVYWLRPVLQRISLKYTLKLVESVALDGATLLFVTMGGITMGDNSSAILLCVTMGGITMGGNSSADSCAVVSCWELEDFIAALKF